MSSPSAVRTRASTSARVVPGRIRQSTSAVARAGITLRLFEPHSMVGAIVEPISARIESPNPAYSRSASASAFERSGSSRPRSARSIAIASGAGDGSGSPSPRRGSRRARRGTALRPSVGTDA